MNLFARLRSETLRAVEENELPDHLAVRLLALVDLPDCYHDADGEILQLIEMLPLYDTYAQCGYVGMGVSNCIIEAAIRRLEESIGAGRGQAPTTCRD
ncbi:MAG: hypothetical protein HZC44_03400 [Geobacter sp.]|nr:hypothetical protein [Geobacter sp.]